MMTHLPHPPQHGFSLLEVLISIVVLAFGLLGLGSLQMGLQSTYIEAQQRSQAVQIMRDIAERLNANTAQAGSYVTGTATPVGVGDGRSSDCTAAGLSVDQRDMCEWSQRLKGVAETQGADELGAMIGARGCIELLQAQDASEGVCLPGVYRVSVAWQGSRESAPPDSQLTCGADKYGSEAFRRVFASTLAVGTLSCK